MTEIYHACCFKMPLCYMRSTDGLHQFFLLLIGLMPRLCLIALPRLCLVIPPGMCFDHFHQFITSTHLVSFVRLALAFFDVS